MYGGKFAFKNRFGYSLQWEGNLPFLVFYFVFEGNLQVQAPAEAYTRSRDITEVFLRYRLGGLIFGGAYMWRGYSGILRYLFLFPIDHFQNKK